MKTDLCESTSRQWTGAIYASKSSILHYLTGFKRNLDYEVFLLRIHWKYKIEQGEVYEVDFGRNIGSELNERHYAVVLHNSEEDAQNIVVVPLTTKVHYSYGEAIGYRLLTRCKH